MNSRNTKVQAEISRVICFSVPRKSWSWISVGWASLTVKRWAAMPSTFSSSLAGWPWAGRARSVTVCGAVIVTGKKNLASSNCYVQIVGVDVGESR